MPVRELRKDELVLENTQSNVRPLRPDEEIRRDLTSTEEFGRGVNVGISEVLGLPGDIINAISAPAAELGRLAGGYLRELSGKPRLTPEQEADVQRRSRVGLDSRTIRQGFSALGIAPPPGQEDPDSFLGSAGHMVGAASASLLGLGPALRTPTAQQAKSITGRIFQEIGRSATESPGRFLAGETVSAGLAGGGGFAARQLFPDSEAASFVGEILGGVSPIGVGLVTKVTPTLIGVRAVRQMVRERSASFALPRAEKRIRQATREPDEALRGLEEEVLPEAGLTPAQRIGDEGLLSLEKSVMESSEQLKGQADEQIETATAAIRRSLEDVGEGVSPERTAEAFEEARSHLLNLLDVRLRIAAKTADERIAALGPNTTRREANLVAREELEKALSAARQQERELFAAIPKKVFVPTKNTGERYDAILSETPRAQRDDIPDIAKQFLQKSKVGTRKIGKKNTLNELQGLRSKLLEEARVARADGRFNQARIADELADAILTDLGASRGAAEGEAGMALRNALDFSFDLNERFTRGTVGKLLGTERRGGVKVAEELTLETTIAKGGPKARAEAEALLEAAAFSEREPALTAAINDFLLDDFIRSSVKEGALSRRSALQFLKKNQDLLDDFPDARTKIEDAIDAGDVATIRKERAEGIAKRLSDPKVSRAAVFLKEPLEQAMVRVSKSSQPDLVMRELVRQTKRDPSGDALKGLKTAFGDFLILQSEARQTTQAGQAVISGTKLKELLNTGSTAKMADELLSPEELGRMRVVANTAEKLERSLAARPSPEGIISDRPSLLTRSLAGVLGAAVGRKAGRATGSGGTVQIPGRFANFFERTAERLNVDPARKFLIDSIGDEKLFKAALLDVKTREDEAFVRRQLNAWLAASGIEQIKDEE